MRGVIAFFMVIGMGAVGVHSYSPGGGGPAERVIHADPNEIVEAMNRELRSEGMEVVSRSDSGDTYRLALTAEELRQHPKYSRMAAEGDLTLDAHVTSSRIEFVCNFESGLAVGYTIDLSRAADGNGTLAQVHPLVRNTGRDDARMQTALESSFRRYGEQTLEVIADAAESDAPQPTV